MQELPKTSDILTSSIQESELKVVYDLSVTRTFNELKLCVIPIAIEGEISKQIFDLLIDTGAEVTVLTREAAQIIGLSITGSLKAEGAGGTSRYTQGIVKNIEIGQQLSLGASRVAVGQLPNKFINYNILGILGAETIQEICLKVNYQRKYLEFSQESV